MYRPGPRRHNGLIHELATAGVEKLSPNFPPMWTGCGYTPSQEVCRWPDCWLGSSHAQDGWATPFGDFNHRWLSALFRPIRPVKDLLNGTWLGHPVHAASPTSRSGSLLVARRPRPARPAGRRPTSRCWRRSCSMLAAARRRRRRLHRHRRHRPDAGDAPLDADGRGARRARRLARRCARRAPADRTVADRPVVIGVPDRHGRRLRRRRRRLRPREHGQPPRVPRRRHEVDRARPRRRGRPGDAPRGDPTKAKAGHQRPRRSSGSATRSSRCTPCAPTPAVRWPRARVVDGCIECPWHGSRFRLATATSRRSGVYDQPAYEIRGREGGGYEVRRAASVSRLERHHRACRSSDPGPVARRPGRRRRLRQVHASRRAFDPDEILSSDALRAVSPATRPISASAAPRSGLHRDARPAAAAGRLTVVDATNVDGAGRRALAAPSRGRRRPGGRDRARPAGRRRPGRNATRRDRVVDRGRRRRHLGDVRRIVAIGRLDRRGVRPSSCCATRTRSTA